MIAGSEKFEITGRVRRSRSLPREHLLQQPPHGRPCLRIHPPDLLHEPCLIDREAATLMLITAGGSPPSEMGEIGREPAVSIHVGSFEIDPDAVSRIR
jgi:hypothetical protein